MGAEQIRMDRQSGDTIPVWRAEQNTVPLTQP